MSAQSTTDETEAAVGPAAPSVSHSWSLTRWAYCVLVAASFALGMLVSWTIWGGEAAASITERAQPSSPSSQSGSDSTASALADAFLEEVNPPQGYRLPASFGKLGPQLLQSGAIDYDKFAQAGTPLTQPEIDILRQGSDQPIVITAENAHFLLNFFWAVGLANKNSILTDGPITKASNGRIDGFASTGGWTLAAKPVSEVFAKSELISLTPEQQSRVKEASMAIYRPCCNNPAFFPDCNHGMAVLGLLELMASQGASVNEMLQAAKYVNAFWFPQQTVEAAIFLKAARNIDFVQADPRLVVGADMSSGSGAQQVHAQLKANGLLPASADNNGSCGA